MKFLFESINLILVEKDGVLLLFWDLLLIIYFYFYFYLIFNMKFLIMIFNYFLPWGIFGF